MHFGRSRASLLWRSLLVSRGVPVPVCCGVPLPLPFLSSASYSAAAPQASNIFPMALCRIASGQQLRYGAPASNKPHLAEKSTPVWLAIWRTWAGFANSQLRCATFRSTYEHICAHPHCCHLGLLLKQTQISRPICTDCLRHLRISAG